MNSRVQGGLSGAALVIVAVVLAGGCESDLPVQGIDDWSPPDTVGSCAYLMGIDASMPSGGAQSSGAAMSTRDGGLNGDAGRLDAGEVVNLPEEYLTFESAFIYTDLICSKSIDCGIDDDLDACTASVPTLEEVCWTTAQLTGGLDAVSQAPGDAGTATEETAAEETAAEETAAMVQFIWDATDKENCRAALVDMDYCSLELTCSDYEFFLVNTVAGFETGQCGDADGLVIECPEEYPCASEKLQFFTACRSFLELLQQSFYP